MSMTADEAVLRSHLAGRHDGVADPDCPRCRDRVLSPRELKSDHARGYHPVPVKNCPACAYREKVTRHTDETFARLEREAHQATGWPAPILEAHARGEHLHAVNAFCTACPLPIEHAPAVQHSIRAELVRPEHSMTAEEIAARTVSPLDLLSETLISADNARQEQLAELESLFNNAEDAELRDLLHLARRGNGSLIALDLAAQIEKLIECRAAHQAASVAFLEEQNRMSR